MQKLAKWHQTRLGLSLFVVIELALAYWLISLAVDRGNLWWYLIAFILIVGSVHNVIKLIRGLFS